MHSNGPRQPYGFGPRAPAALALLAVVAVAVSLVRAAFAVHDHAGRDAAREAELDEWAYSGIR